MYPLLQSIHNMYVILIGISLSYR